MWLTRDEVCARLRISKSTVESWAVQRTGPPFAKFGRHVRYRLSDLIDWENAQIGGGAR
ncbi:helix-turn-helix transcriptional regulator [Mycobacterium sp. SA01]|uniref:helix-turn-helix transcriptional regulator n=1 Tax=Mycobacterium sp. SA01 TaxID=3238820 RepID=UPI00351BA996